MTDTPPVLTLDGALAAFHAVIATLAPADQTRVYYAISDVVPLGVDELTAVADLELRRIPLLGGFAVGFANSAIASAGQVVLSKLLPPT